MIRELHPIFNKPVNSVLESQLPSQVTKVFDTYAKVYKRMDKPGRQDIVLRMQKHFEKMGYPISYYTIGYAMNNHPVVLGKVELT